MQKYFSGVFTALLAQAGVIVPQSIICTINKIVPAPLLIRVDCRPFGGCCLCLDRLLFEDIQCCGRRHNVPFHLLLRFLFSKTRFNVSEKSMCIPRIHSSIGTVSPCQCFPEKIYIINFYKTPKANSDTKNTTLC